MVKRKSISIINSLGRVNSLPSIVDNRLVSTDSILSTANKLRDRYSNDAYNNYNASLFPEIKTNIESIQFEQPTIEIQEEPLSYNKSKKTSSSYKGSKNDFINNIYNSYYKAVRPGAASDADADRQARFLTQKAAFETGWGKHIANTHNYGGHKGKNGWLSFNSMDDFTRKDVALLDKKWGNWRNAKNEGQFIDAINTNNGYGMYAPPTENTNYKGRYSSLTSGINNTINMGRRKLRCGGKTDRPKAWIGAVVGAAGSILGSIFSSDAQRRQQEELRRQQEHQAALERAEGLTESLGLMQAAQKEYENRFRVNYANGGRRRLRQGVQITDGGAFVNSSTGRVYGPGDNIPNGVYDVLDYTHEEENPSGNNGNGIKVGHKNIEVEKGERIIKDNDEIFVESNTIKIPTPYGLDTAANADRAGVDRTYVKRIQQSLNGNYNGDRTREAIKKIGRKNYLRGYNIIDHMRNGGYITRPVGRIKAELGLAASNNVSWVPKGFRGRTIAAFGKPGDIRYGRQLYNHNEKKYIDRWTMTDDGKVSHTIVPYEGQRPIVNKKGSYVNAANTEQNSSAYAKAKIAGTTNTLVGSGDKRPRSLKTAGAKTVNNSVITQTSSNNNFSPDYTEQQMLDYINGNRTVADNTQNNTQNNNYTDPNEAILREMASKDPNYNGTNTNVSGTTTKLGDVTGNTNKWGTIFKGSDKIGFVADLIGSFGSALINYNAADNIGDPIAPVRYSPGKLITNWNIAPRLSEVDKTEYSMLKNTDDMFSSAGRNKAIQQIKIWGNQQRDKLWGEKTNREVELGNADTLNQQQVNAQNVTAYNDYLNRLYDARTRRGLMRSQALQVGLSGLSDAVGNFIDQGKQRYSDQQAMRYYTALLPENGRQWLRRNGVDFLRRGGRIK